MKLTAPTDDLVRLWRWKVKITSWFKYFMVKASTSMLGKEKERKSIYVAPFIYYVYLKALRHGSHSFTCKYTTPAFR